MCQASVSPDQISTFSNIYRHKSPIPTLYQLIESRTVYLVSFFCNWSIIQILYYFLSLIHHPTWELNLMFDVYYRKTKAFRAIAPSSVVFQKWLEHFFLLDKSWRKRKKWKWRLDCPHFHFEAHKSYYNGKNNFWILQLLFPPASAPPLPPSPSNTEAWWPPHLTQRSKGRVVNQEVLSQLSRIYYDLVSQLSNVQWASWAGAPPHWEKKLL